MSNLQVCPRCGQAMPYTGEVIATTFADFDQYVLDYREVEEPDPTYAQQYSFFIEQVAGEETQEELLKMARQNKDGSWQFKNGTTMMKRNNHIKVQKTSYFIFNYMGQFTVRYYGLLHKMQLD